MHTLESIIEIEDELKQEWLNDALPETQRKRAYRKLGKMFKIKDVVREGFSEDHLRFELARLIGIQTAIERKIDQYATSKFGEVIKDKKAEIEEDYDGPMVRSQIKNIRFILEG